MLPNLAQHPLRIIHHLPVAEAQHLETAAAKDISSGLVLDFALIMDRTVHFDHQARFVAVEIDDKASDDLLPSKMPAVQPVCTQISPQTLFCRCHRLAQFPSSLLLLGINPLPCDDAFFGHSSILA